MSLPLYGSVKVNPCSGNEKTGEVVATYAPTGLTCSHHCPFRAEVVDGKRQAAGCYADTGRTAIASRKISKGRAAPATALEAAQHEADLFDTIRHPPAGRPVRLHVSGDCLTGEAARIVSAAVERYQRRGGGDCWTYTHSWRYIDREDWGSISVLASCETIEDVIAARRRGYASALVVSEHPADGRAELDASGVTLLPCPEQTRGVQCVKCGLCLRDQWLDENATVITLATHGSVTKANRALAMRAEEGGR